MNNDNDLNLHLHDQKSGYGFATAVHYQKCTLNSDCISTYKSTCNAL